MPALADCAGDPPAEAAEDAAAAAVTAAVASAAQVFPMLPRSLDTTMVSGLRGAVGGEPELEVEPDLLPGDADTEADCDWKDAAATGRGTRVRPEAEGEAEGEAETEKAKEVGVEEAAEAANLSARWALSSTPRAEKDCWAATGAGAYPDADFGFESALVTTPADTDRTGRLR